MGEKILKLRAEGKSYSEIQKILGCSKSTISYHCGKGQKEKSAERQRKRKSNPIVRRVDRFKTKKLYDNLRLFQKKDLSKKKRVNPNIEMTFTYKDVVEKFGEDTICYLSGEKINLFEGGYHFDHIIPSSKGGDNSFDNLGILHETVNKMKHDLTPKEFIEWCVKILKYNGYNVTK